MTKQIQNAVNKVLENQELSKKLIKLETVNEIFEFLKSIDSGISKEDFEEAINELLEKSGEKLSDESLSKVSGGVINENLRKPIAATLAALSLGSTQIHAMPKSEVKTSKIVSKALWTTLGITSTVALGATIYHLMNNPETSNGAKPKKFYYKILKKLDKDQFSEVCKKLQCFLNEDAITLSLLEDFLTKRQIRREDLDLNKIEELILDKEFFNLIPFCALYHMFPQEADAEIKHRQELIKAQEVSTSSFVKSLPNLGNSCYLNVILQLLRQIPEAKNGKLNENGNEKIKHLNSLMKIINSSRNTLFDNKLEYEIQTLISLLHPGEEGTQQDANETLIKLGLPYDSMGLSIITPENINFGLNYAEENPFLSYGVSIKDAKHKIFCTPNKDIQRFTESYISNGRVYELKCIVCHYSNHYYAYLKSDKGEWRISSDESSKPVPRELVLTDERIKTKAVMLLYSQN